MPEIQDDHIARIGRLHRIAIARPDKYALRARSLAMSAHALPTTAALFCAMILLAIVVVALNGPLLLLVVLPLTIYYVRPVVLVRALLGSMPTEEPTPAGREVTRTEVPELFTAVEAAADATGTTEIDRIVLTDGFGLVRTSVDSEHYLTIGYQLLAAISCSEAQVLLEMGLQRSRSAYTELYLGIARARLCWQEAGERLRHRRHWAAPLIAVVSTWLLRRFDAHEFVLTRLSVLDADARIAQRIGIDRLGQALLDVHVRQHVLNEEFWPRIFDLTEDREQPPESIHLPLTEMIERGIDPEETKLLVNQTLLQHGSAQGFPTLAERFEALGTPAPVVAPMSGHSAAREYLGDSLERIAHDLDEAWRATVAADWREQHHRVVQARRELENIREKIAHDDPLSSDEMVEYAAWRERNEGTERALPLYRSVVENDPASAIARFLLGQAYLSLDDDRGIEHIEQAVCDDGTLAISGFESIHEYLNRHGRHQEADALRRRYLPIIAHEVSRREAVNELAVRERMWVDSDGDYLPHALPGEQIEELRRIFAAFDRVDDVYLVRKHLVYFPERPLYVFGIVLDGSKVGQRSRNGSRALTRRLNDRLRFLGDTVIVVLNDRKNRKLRGLLEPVSGAHLYRRDATGTTGEQRNGHP